MSNKNKCLFKIVSKESNSYSSKDLSNTYKIMWRGIDVFINPNTSEMYHKFRDRIKLIGLASYDEDELYTTYLELLDS